MRKVKAWPGRGGGCSQGALGHGGWRSRVVLGFQGSCVEVSIEFKIHVLRVDDRNPA